LLCRQQNIRIFGSRIISLFGSFFNATRKSSVLGSWSARDQ
jgi:hypothetical protein